MGKTYPRSINVFKNILTYAVHVADMASKVPAATFLCCSWWVGGDHHFSSHCITFFAEFQKALGFRATQRTCILAPGRRFCFLTYLLNDWSISISFQTVLCTIAYKRPFHEILYLRFCDDNIIKGRDIWILASSCFTQRFLFPLQFHLPYVLLLSFLFHDEPYWFLSSQVIPPIYGKECSFWSYLLLMTQSY